MAMRVKSDLENFLDFYGKSYERDVSNVVVADFMKQDYCLIGLNDSEGKCLVAIKYNFSNKKFESWNESSGKIQKAYDLYMRRYLGENRFKD